VDAAMVEMDWRRMPTTRRNLATRMSGYGFVSVVVMRFLLLPFLHEILFRRIPLGGREK
jgi:hypothetical protein